MPSYTHAQLHEAACITCGEPGDTLVPAGHVRTETRPGQFLTWAVVAHPDHAGER